jgi:membrane glycosyltransferase
MLAVPFTVLTANPALGRFMRARGIAAIPEDFTPPAEIADVAAQSAR